jgi:IK cytokine
MGDIFEDAGREYELSEDVESTTAATSNASKGNYFQGLVKEDDQEDQEMEAVTDEAVTALLAKASKSNIESEPGDEQQEKQPESKKRKYDMTVDADAADIDMFGLSTSALPTSFEDHQTNTTAYQSDDDDQEDKGVQFVDQGTHRNKKAQLTRWDFDNEEEYQKYKDSVEIHPKSAFQFGVKLGDGRKRNRERKGMDEKQRLNRDYQQVKSIMEKKYGQNL